MKNLKKAISLIMALVMVVALSISAMATTITINDEGGTSTYEAYKLMDATNAKDAEGNASDKFSYTLNGKYETILKAVTGKTDDADVIAYLSELANDSPEIRAFADNVYQAVKAAGLEADATATNGKFDVNQGYYLIAEIAVKAVNDDGSRTDAISLVMLDTAGLEDITVATKENVPTVEKKVQDTDDSTGAITDWQDSADYDIGDEIPYQVTGTVSNEIENYKTYYYEFVDTMTNLTYKANSAVVMIDSIDVTDQFTVSWDNDTKTLTATPNTTGNDLKKVSGVSLTGTSEVVLTYYATLDADANIGATGNPNEVYLKFNNNPYHEGNGIPENPGETPKDKNIVFTFEGIVNKVDGENQPLKDAGFTLYKFDKVANDYVVYKNGLTVDASGTTFTAKGLDAGQYKIVETTVPAGYNKADDLEFTITATHSETADDPELLTLTVDNAKVTANKDAGTVSTDVVNNSGTELPSTGGIGTTLFYVVGGIMVAAAAVLLVTKKRMGKEE